MKKKILITDDSVVNQKILSKILSPDYEIAKAANGLEAIRLIDESKPPLSAVVLDLNMPVMSGYEVLEKLKANRKYSNIPIIVATGSNDKESEQKALALGAWDFISKPYDAEILKFRLKNAIDRSKLHLFDKLKHQAEHDLLTDIYNQSYFLVATREMLDKNPDAAYAIVRFDVARFKQYNLLFGRKAGDAFLKYIASRLTALGESSDRNNIYARLEADIFVGCIQYAEKSALMHTIKEFQNTIKQYSRDFDIVMDFGIYYVTDRSMAVDEMLDLATVAAKKQKGSYEDTVSVFTDEMLDTLRRDQEISNVMQSALEQQQFCVYYQPKYNSTTDKPYGAEALVRWNRPGHGMISPGIFIPTFEKNGFIAKVDYYVWEKVCEDIKQWIVTGKRVIPVSVNVSRVNLSNPNIVEIISDLVAKHGIDPSLFQLEITESAYMDNPEIMTHIVSGLHEKGFTILMDDFGSGYSSLNTLKDIPVDVLKIDMKFLPSGDKNIRSEKILASMIRMANWLGMPAIVEGVETKAQLDFLKSVGCIYVQGYYYARPMPKEEFELLLAQEAHSAVADDAWPEQNEMLDSLLSSDPKTEALLSGIPLPVAVYEYTENGLDRLRANQAFFDAFGYENDKNSTIRRFTESEQLKFDTAIKQVSATQQPDECEVFRIVPNGALRWFRINLRYITKGTVGYIISATFTDITREKQVEAEVKKIAGVLNKQESRSNSILIVDDTEISREVLKTLFANQFTVLEAENGQEALDILKVHRDDISIILLDMFMPVMDGSEFLAHKNHMEGADDIPVVIISADQRENMQIGMLHSGVNDYVTKPFVPDVVLKRVQNVLDYQSRFSKLVSEYKQTVSLMPLVGSNLDFTYLALRELRALLTYLRQIFDVVRIVDPTDTSVLTVSDNDEIIRAPYSCFKVWNKSVRCKNCSSACAMQNNCQMTKYEFINNNIFYVVSRPLELLLGTDNSIQVVLEIVSHVSDSLMLQSVNGVSLKSIVETTREKVYHDPLTGAYNRRYLNEMLFLHHGRNDTAKQVAIVMMDMDGFKRINDQLGHLAGDECLTKVANTLRNCTRENDSVIRYGGDEFIIVLTDIPEPQLPSKIEQLAQKIKSISYGNNEKYLLAKFGFAYAENFVSNRTFLNRMIAQADQRMYEKKSVQGDSAAEER